MNPIPFAEFLERFPCILGEGAVIERLRRNSDLDLDPYLINCTHASFARAALTHEANSSPRVLQRIIGLLANTAPLSPEDLNDSTILVEEDPQRFGRALADLHRELGLKIVGGCCGTDDRRIRALAAQLATGLQGGADESRATSRLHSGRSASAIERQSEQMQYRSPPLGDSSARV
jgi:hypothetical protein